MAPKKSLKKLKEEFVKPVTDSDVMVMNEELMYVPEETETLQSIQNRKLENIKASQDNKLDNIKVAQDRKAFQINVFGSSSQATAFMAIPEVMRSVITGDDTTFTKLLEMHSFVSDYIFDKRMEKLQKEEVDLDENILETIDLSNIELK